jgi:hypothetical protein
MEHQRYFHKEGQNYSNTYDCSIPYSILSQTFRVSYPYYRTDAEYPSKVHMLKAWSPELHYGELVELLRSRV